MADTKVTALTADATPGLDSLLYTVDDPAGTPAPRKTALSELLITLGVGHGAGEISITGAATATIGKMHVCSGTTVDYIVTLPAASGNAGKRIGFRMATGLTKFVTIDGNAAETINGALSRVMQSGESLILLCDGSNYFWIGGNSRPLLCTMIRTTSQTAIVTATATKVLLNSIAEEQSPVSGTLGDTTNNRIIIKRPGIYNITGVVRWTALTADSVNTYTMLTKNGTTLTERIAETQVYGPLNSAIAIVAFASVTLAVDDVIYLVAYHSSGVNEAVTGSATIRLTYLSVEEIPSW